MTAGHPVASLRGHEDMIMGLAFSPDGKLLASGSHDGSVRLWDVAKRSERNVFRGHAPGHFVLAVAFSRDGRLLASGSSDETVKLWDVDTGKVQATLSGHADSVESVAFSPTADVLASAAAGDVLLWDVATGKRIATLDTDTGNATKVAFSPDGKSLAAVGLGETVEIWDLADFAKKVDLQTRGSKFGVAYSPDGTTIIVLGKSAVVGLFDARTYQHGERILADSGLESALSLAVLPDSKTVALAFRKGAKCLDTTPVLAGRAREEAYYPVRDGADGVVAAIAVSPDGKTLAVSDDREIKLFDLTSIKKRMGRGGDWNRIGLRE